MKIFSWWMGALWGWALLGCGGGDGGYAVLTFNTGLARGLVSYTDQRGPAVASALGRSGARFHPEKVDIAYGEHLVARNGWGLGPEASAAAARLIKAVPSP